MTKGLEVKIPKEVPSTHNCGKLISFHCNKCGKFICACYETDFLRNAGVDEGIHYCSHCGNRLDFGEYYHKPFKNGNDELKFEGGE